MTVTHCDFTNWSRAEDEPIHRYAARRLYGGCRRLCCTRRCCICSRHSRTSGNVQLESRSEAGPSGAQQDHGQGEGIAPAPCQFGHKSEVHAVNSRDQRRRYADDGYDREHSEQIVLFDRYESQHGIEQKLDFVRELALVVIQRPVSLLPLAGAPQQRFDQHQRKWVPCLL